MREIKLRAWYKGDYIDAAMMCDVVGFEKTSDHYDTFTLDSHAHIGCGRLAVPRYRIQSDESNCVIMQYTGLKDENDVEIYEGDIVKTKQALYQDISVLVWDGLGFGLKSIKELPHPSCRKFEYGWISPICEYFKFEIIGNIYENPEFLQAED